VGLRADQLGVVLAADVLGGALAQWPAGWAADRNDRRAVLMWFSVGSIAACGITVAMSGMGVAAIFVAALLFGAATFPIYSISAAHAHDWAEDSQRVELSAALMFFYALGATAAPLVTAGLIAAYGPSALFAFIAVAHVGLLIFGVIRMRKRASADQRNPYVWIPRTSFQVGRIFRRSGKD